MRKESLEPNTEKNLQLQVDTQEIDNGWRDNSTEESTEGTEPSFIQASSVSEEEGESRGPSDRRRGK